MLRIGARGAETGSTWCRNTWQCIRLRSTEAWAAFQCRSGPQHLWHWRWMAVRIILVCVGGGGGRSTHAWRHGRCFIVDMDTNTHSTGAEWGSEIFVFFGTGPQMVRLQCPHLALAAPFWNGGGGGRKRSTHACAMVRISNEG